MIHQPGDDQDQPQDTPEIVIHLEAMDDRLAALTIRDYCCSNCWGQLNKFPVKGTQSWLVKCINCGDATVGYHSKWFAEHEQSKSLGDKMDVTSMLTKIGIIQRQRQGVEKILSDLGF